MKANIATLDALEELAIKMDGRLESDYSGRGMYGKSCYGVVCNSPERCIEEAGELGIKGARVDGMGKRSIVYWPHLQAA